MEESHFTITKWKKWGKIRRKLDQNSNLNGENDADYSTSPPPQSVSPRITAHTGETELAKLPDQQVEPQAQPAGGSFFHSASDVKISGVTNFTTDSSQNHNTSVTIVFNSQCEVTGLGQVIQSSPASLETVQLPQIKGGDSEPIQSASCQIPLRAPSLPVQKSSAIYFRHLASKGLGSPLWIPEPSINLPISYQVNGISIGDVGFLTDRGSFSFLFNICTSASDPINPNDMPEWFHPLSKPDPMDVDEHSEFKSNSYLASSLVETLHEDTAGLIFESSALEGAILTMPKGSRSRDLVNVVNFRKYAYDNAENWYKYANKTRGHGVKNGELRLVLGLNSASAWGMATFANHSTSSTSTNTSPTDSEKRNGFRLKFKPIKEGNLVGGQAYGWECGSGMAEVKSGPDIGEVERLRSAHAAECNQGINDGAMSMASAAAFENQSLFIRTLNVTLQDDVWKKLSTEWEGLYIGDDSFSPSKLPLSDSDNSHSRGNGGLGSTEHPTRNSDRGQDHNSSCPISQGPPRLSPQHYV